MQPEADHAEMKHLLKRQMELLEENNRLLRKLHRRAVWGFWLRVVFYGLFLGVPLLLYLYVLQPYLASLDQSYQDVLERIEQIPNFDRVNQLIEHFE